ncbi:MAG TPA: hypothetical protein VFB07_03245 [Vicinamibacterales bacterium]|nr:hypothetical protein [Vicinamibacterales bacterium]
MGTEPVDYCREIETYLCRKNDGHLLRVVGPSFARVADWERRGVPLKVVFAGIDRYFERYYRQGPRRRPVKIDFCEADVLDVFDEWKRAVGFVQPAAAAAHPSRESLPAHLERVLTKLSSARASGAIGDAFDPAIDAVARELDAARAAKGGLRGEARHAAIDRLADMDRQLTALARSSADAARLAALEREADEELASFRSAMAPDAYGRAREAAVDRLLRERLGLPTVAFS